MTNFITSQRSPGTTALRMSNGLAAAVLDVLVIAGCELATTPWEQQLVYWLAQHDQTRIGSGNVGFDIDELGWTRADFSAQKQFVLALVDAARDHRGWERLSFAPREDWVLGALAHLRELVDGFDISLAAEPPSTPWRPGELPPYGACELHRVYLHESGCMICNDAPIDATAAAAPHRSRPR